MTLVIDASALLDDVAGTKHRLSGRVADHEFAAPALIDLELLQTLRAHARGGRISVEDAEDRLALLIDTPGLTRFEHSELAERIWELRENFTAYDASYVALAERLGVALVTTDLPLARAARSHASCEVIAPDDA